MKLKLLPHQSDFCADYTTPYLALIGGFGAGKTRAFCYKTIIMAGLNAGYEGAIAEPTNYLTRNHLIPNMKLAMEEMGVPYTYEASSQIFHLTFKEGSTKIYCLSGENYERLVGYNLAFFGSDETDTSSTEIANEMWNKAISRVRWGRHRQIYSTSTPEGHKFLYQYFVKDKDDTKRTIHASSMDNPLLDKEYLESMRAKYTEAQWKVWALGQFGNLHTQRVYETFDRELNHTDQTLKNFARSTTLHIGMDFNIGHMAAVVHVIDNNLPIAVEELVEIRDVPTMIHTIKTKYPNHPVIVYPDASGKNRSATGMDTSIALLKQAGFMLKYNPANPPVGDRVNSMNAMFCNALGQRRYLVNTRMCPFYTQALEEQAWVKGEPDKSNNIDHCLDAGGYFVHWNYPLTGKPTLRTY